MASLKDRQILGKCILWATRDLHRSRTSFRVFAISSQIQERLTGVANRHINQIQEHSVTGSLRNLTDFAQCVSNFH